MLTKASHEGFQHEKDETNERDENLRNKQYSDLVYGKSVIYRL